MTKRLIEEWLPIAELGIESVRERTPMTPFPAPNRLHVWWARRPLVASRAAVLASLLPADADRDIFMHAIGIHGDPLSAKKLIEKAKRTGIRVDDPYGYQRAFHYSPSSDERQWLRDQHPNQSPGRPVVLDPTAGGGAIPLEALRLGCDVFANDINPVAVFIQRATYEWPSLHGTSLVGQFHRIYSKFRKKLEARLRDYYPQPDAPSSVIGTYLWARSIKCPYCEGCIPLAPNWKLTAAGKGVRLLPRLGSGPGDSSRHCEFEIVEKTSEHSQGTVSQGSARCPFPDCGRIISADQIRQESIEGRMGDQLYAVAGRQRLADTFTKTGKLKKAKWEKYYRPPLPHDYNQKAIDDAINDKLPEWEALGFLPDEPIESAHPKADPRTWGINQWKQFFSARQIVCHCTCVEVFRAISQEEADSSGSISEEVKAALGYVALALNKILNRNSKGSTWIYQREVVAQFFQRHDLSLKWSYAEIEPLVEGLGFDWAFSSSEKCLSELVAFISEDPITDLDGPLFSQTKNCARRHDPPSIKLSCESGDSLSHIASSSVDAIVLDPPYYDNVMYAELSDYFYVWLKRTAGYVHPDLFGLYLTNKTDEAVANIAKYKGEKNSSAKASLDYLTFMSSIFVECRRVLRPDGVMTLMFTHKATGAWDALAKGLIDAGFVITASWPINTEAEGSLHIKDKSAANSTIFLVCRPRPAKQFDDGVQYWEDLEPRVKAAVRTRIEQFQAGGIRGVDLYLSCFGPALEEFSLHWPIKRGQPKTIEEKSRKRGRAQITLEELLSLEDPYSVSPEDALDAARREVKAWRMEKLTSGSRRAQLDPLTEWFVLAWDAFEAPQFPFDEALRLARVVGLDLDKDVVGVLAEKKASDLILWDSSTRATKGKLGSPDGTRSWIDAIHHCAHRARSIDLNAAKQLLDDNGLANSADFLTALEAVLEVLPLSARYTGFDPVKAAAPAASDFEALENLRRLALAEQVAAPKQLELVLAELAEA
jgi:putative DNA methylase